MTTVTNRIPAVAAALDPLASCADRHYVDDLVRVIHHHRGELPEGRGEAVVRTKHFCLRRCGREVEVHHWITPGQLDNDLTGLLAEELFHPGWLTGNDIFERVFTGVVRSTVPDPLPAWNTFYSNTLTKIKRHWLGKTLPPDSLTAHMAPVYDRAVKLVPEGSVLDLGSCFGFFPLLLAERADTEVIASDVVAGSMRLLATIARSRRVGVRTMTCNATSVPLPENSVDTVTALHLLEHLAPEQGRAVIAEALRLARNWVVLAVPFEDEPEATYGHVRRFDRSALTTLGVASGRPYTVSEFHGGWLVLDAHP